MINSKKCQVCNEEFIPRLKTSLFCSHSCSNKSRGFYYKNQVICEWCGKNIDRPSPSKTHRFCSKECEMNDKRKSRIEIECQQCHIKFRVQPSLKDRKFCSRKCMGLAYKNQPKYYKTRWRSFGECAMVVLLKKNYPSIEIVLNDRMMLDGFEMDIWLPSLKIGIEYNGQHHYKSVYGEKVFKKTVNSDKAKRAIASRKGINIITIKPEGTISKTTKTKIKNLFLECCDKIGLSTPTNLDFTKEEVLSEQSS